MIKIDPCFVETRKKKLNIQDTTSLIHKLTDVIISKGLEWSR